VVAPDRHDGLYRSRVQACFDQRNATRHCCRHESVRVCAHLGSCELETFRNGSTEHGERAGGGRGATDRRTQGDEPIAKVEQVRRSEFGPRDDIDNGRGLAGWCSPPNEPGPWDQPGLLA